MSYVVLARRYRPQTFHDIVGQEPIVKTLENAINSNRVAHAYLLAGPRGVGKTSTARILSKALNCRNGPTASPCNKCDICQSISEGSDIDVLEIDGASNRGIDEVRNLRQNVGYAPSRSHYRVYIIDEVHMLTREAFNALLKTLEEPPSHVKFIFATTAVNRLPETVISRCQRLDFKNISTPEIENRLLDICKTENVEIEPAAVQTIARYARGGLRDSQSVLDQLLSFCKDMITVADVNYILGYIDEDKIKGVFDSFVKKDIPSALSIVDNVLNEGKAPVDFVDQLLSRLRELLIFSSCGKDVTWMDFSESFIQQYGKSFSSDNLMYMIQVLSTVRMRTTDSLLPRIMLEMAIIKLCRMEAIGSLNDVAERLVLLENKLDQIKGENNRSLTVSAKDSDYQQVAREKPEEEYHTKETKEKTHADFIMDNGEVWKALLQKIQNKKKKSEMFFFLMKLEMWQKKLTG